ncbi:hypothetical protein C5E10_09210 [Pseudoclavibacter sp. RFBG4]|nr:hypothetical protein C5E10_09210 [Pseudoclavibacter sp. RFBG4]
MAPLDWLEDQDARMADPSLSVHSAVSVSDAQARQVNASGTISEGIVDAAGNGFIGRQAVREPGSQYERAPRIAGVPPA